MAEAGPSSNGSPATSPRLPSPPPFPEVQVTPKSPINSPNAQGSMGEIQSQGDYQAQKLIEQGTKRRIRPGTKAANFGGPPLIPLNELDSSFQLQEHLKALHYHHTRSSTDASMTTPIARDTAATIATPPPNVDRYLWLYELCRLLVQRTNTVCVAFFSEDPPCSASTCPEMRASEWQYLCAVHEPPKSCCAIDYCCHTLEWAADTLASSKNFPSRLTLEATGVRQLTNIMRRVYRIFAHAWFSHRSVFWQIEGDEGLYILFKTVCDVYSLIPEENYTVPPEAEGLAGKMEETSELGCGQQRDSDRARQLEDSEEKTTLSTGATTRRHKHTPSLGSTVTTIHEIDEDDRSPDKEDMDALSGSVERIDLRKSEDTAPPILGSGTNETEGEAEDEGAEQAPVKLDESLVPAECVTRQSENGETETRSAVAAMEQVGPESTQI